MKTNTPLSWRTPAFFARLQQLEQTVLELKPQIGAIEEKKNTASPASPPWKTRCSARVAGGQARELPGRLQV